MSENLRGRLIEALGKRMRVAQQIGLLMADTPDLGEIGYDLIPLIDAHTEQLRAELDRLHSWAGLFELLDEHWPADIFPTLADREGRDPGPRIVSLIRWVEQLRAERDEALGKLAKVQDLLGDDGERNWQQLRQNLDDSRATNSYLTRELRKSRIEADTAYADAEQIRDKLAKVRALHVPIWLPNSCPTLIKGCGRDDCKKGRSGYQSNWYFHDRGYRICDSCSDADGPYVEPWPCVTAQAIDDPS